MRQTVEHEVKLEAPDGFELPDLGGEPLEPRVFTSVYYDTPARSLARAGITLRRRTERGRSLWQLKIPVDGARVELEEPGGPAGPPEGLRTLIRAHERQAAVTPVAELRTRRHGTLVHRDESTAEVTIDEVSIMDAQRVDGRFVEIEIELKDGEPRALVRIAEELARSGAREGDGLPKVFRVLELDTERKKPKTSFDALRARLREQLDAILANDPGTRLGSDPESLHDMRVAVRRSRALLRAGRDLVATDTQMLRLELQWLGSVLGDVRDLDVLLARLHAEAAELDPEDRAAAERLLRGLERARGRARRALLKALDGQRYANLLDRFESTLEALESTQSDVSLKKLAGRELKKLGRDVDAAGDDPADETLHALRKRGKRARYAAELAGEKTVVARAKVFQDVLGEHQDSVVAEERLRALAHEAPQDQAVAAGLLIARERASRERARRSWRKAWRALSS
ncbi:MAG TPA: CYTH and CHAD domain-containing protein [Gaiellaceae bacterium]|nr:CYTH and CHAD domain-containing protein [Gaiellaceae bacterium]